MAKFSGKLALTLGLGDREAENAVSAAVSKMLERGILEREWKSPTANSVSLGKSLARYR